MSDSPDSVWTVLSSCGVCSKPLDKDSSPQLLPCCHSSCKECIEDNRNQLLESINTNSTEKPVFKCKICSQDYSPEECIDNWFQLVYWSQNKTNETQICQSCEGQNKSAVIKCKDCDWICEDCQTLHNTIKVFKGHELEENTKISPSEDINKNICSTHNEEITVYCKTCRTAYCCRCILKDHNLHVYEDTKDRTQLSSFYDNFNTKVNSIKEKRSFAENTLQKFETIETEISGQRDQCIAKVKTIVLKLQEKVLELGNNLLDRVNTVCHKKEKEFNLKKEELRQMNSSFKFIEEFMSTILALNDPMGVMKAQDLLNTQLEKLLNKPCSHPDFITAFKIKVIDALSEGQRDGQRFDVSKMIDGVFNMCFKIVTSDDIKEQTINKSVNNVNESNGDDEVSIIGMTKSTTPPTRPAIKTYSNQANQQIQRTVPQSGANVNQNFRPIILRGNKTIKSSTFPPNHQTLNQLNQSLTQMLTNNTAQQNNTYDYNSYNKNQMQGYPQSAHSAAPNTLSSNRLYNNMLYNQAMGAQPNSVPTSNSVSQMQNNFMPQTGLITNFQSYGSPQVYRPPVASNQSVPNASVVPPNVSVPQNTYHYINTINQNGVNNNTLNQQNIRQPYGQLTNENLVTVALYPRITQSVGTTRPAVVYPTANTQTTAQTSNSSIIAQLTQTTNSIIYNQSQASIQSTPQIAANTREQIQRERDIQNIANQLKESTTQAFPESALTNRSANANRSNASAISGQPLPNERTYELHIPEDTSITPITPQTDRRPSRDLAEQRRESVTSNISTPPSPLVRTTQTPVLRNENTERPIDLPIVSGVQTSVSSTVPSTIAVTAPSTISSDVSPTIGSTVTSTPIVSNNDKTNAEKTLETNKEWETTTSADCSEEMILPTLSNPPSINSSLFSELSNDCNSPEIIECNTPQTNRNEENRENSSSVNRSNAPVAVISPITNQTENTNNVSSELVDLRSDDPSDEEQVDEDTDCVVCTKEYGEFICCAKCPRAFHIECHVPELKKMPETSFTCTFCLPSIDGPLNLRTRKPGLNERQQRICEKVLISLLCHKKSQDFKPPVCEELKQNINLISIKRKFENKEFDNEIKFIDEIKRMFAKYKSRDITLGVMEDYNTFERYFKKIVHKFMPSFSEALQNNNSINNFDSSSGSSAKKSKTNRI